MKLLIAAMILILGSPAAGTGCGWTGLALAPPDVEVQGPDVRLERPLQVVRIETGSPADEAGMKRGMEILSLDGERWDTGGFLPNLVRLHTVKPDDVLKIVARDSASQETFRLRARPCDEEQARQRARMLANLGRMAGAVHGRLSDKGHAEALVAYEAGVREFEAARRQAEERLQEEMEAEGTTYERGRREYEAALELAEARLNDPEVQRRLQDSMRAAQEELRLAQEMHGEEWTAQMEESLREMREVMRDEGRREVLQRGLQQARESQEVTRRILEEAHRSMASDEEVRRELGLAMERTRAAMHDEEWRRQMEESLRQVQETLGDGEMQLRMQEALRHVKDSEAARRRLLEELELPQLDEEAQHQMQEAMAQAREAMRDDELRRELEETLQQAQLAQEGASRMMDESMREALEQTRAQQVEMQLVQEQVRRALEDAMKGREVRRMALLEASRATRHLRHAGQLFRGAQFQRLEPGIARHVGAEHGLLVLNLEPDSPLARAGVEPGDVLLSLGGEPVDNLEDVFRIVSEHAEEMVEHGETDGDIDLEILGSSGRRTITLPFAPEKGPVVGPL